MGKKLSLPKKLIAVAIPLLIVGGALAVLQGTQPLPDFIDYATWDTDQFGLNFPAPLALTGAESYLIDCELRNRIQVKDEFGTTRLTIDKSFAFSPVIELSFLIPISGSPQFGSATVDTFLSCSNSPLSSSGFKPFLHDGSVTTKFEGTDVNRSFKIISSRTKTISGITDMNDRQNFNLNSLLITEQQLQNTIGDDTSYPSTIRAVVTGDLQFRQCLSSNPLCTGSEPTNNWIHNIASNQAFTAFGLLVEGGVFAPVTRTQELDITESGVTSTNRLNIKDDNRVNYQIRITDYDIREGSPVTKIFAPDSSVFQTRNEGILTQTDSQNNRIFVKSSSVTLPTTNLGLWCFELQKTEGLRPASRECITTFLADTTPPVEDPEGEDPTTGAKLTSGEVRLRYEVTTTSGVKQNDITSAGGLPVSFTQLGLLAVGGTDSFLSLFLQPQIFFDAGVLDKFNIVSGSADITYTGKIILPDTTVTINALDLKPDPADFTKNQASIILPSTKITASEVELLIFQQAGLPTSGEPITLEILTSGNFQLKETGTGAISTGVFKDTKFSWNLDYIPKDTTPTNGGNGGGSDCSAGSIGTCTDPSQCSGTVIAFTCVTDDLSKCFDANSQPVQCESINDPVEDPMTDDPMDDVGEKCFDAVGVEVSCTVDPMCDPNTDPDRCGGGNIIGDPDDIPDDSEEGKSILCEGLIGSILGCEDALDDVPDAPTMNIFEGLGDNLVLLGIVIGIIMVLLIVIAVIVRIVRNR